MDSHNDDRRTLKVYCALILVAYVSVAGITTVFSMLSKLYQRFDDPARIGWVVSSYFLVSAISAALCGRFGDLFGRRRITLMILPLAGAGALISALSGSLGGVIAGCAIQGVAGALAPLAVGMARESIPLHRVPFAVGVLMASLVAGGGLSFLVAGFVIDHYSWTGGFFMKILLVIAALSATIAWLPDHRRQPDNTGRVNIPVGLLFAPSIAGFFVANQLAQDRGWGSLEVLLILLASLFTLLMWGYHQAHQASPLIDVRSLGTRQVLLANACIGFLALGCMQHGQLLSLFLQQPQWTGSGFGLSASAAGAIFVPLLSISLIASPWSGAIAARRGARAAALYGFVPGIVAWTFNTFFHQSLWFFLAACVLGSACISIVQPAVYNLILEATPEERTSEAVGLTNVFISVFMAIGSQLVTLLLATSTVSDPNMGSGRFPDDAAYILTFSWLAAMSVLGLMAALALRDNPPPTLGHPPAGS